MSKVTPEQRYAALAERARQTGGFVKISINDGLPRSGSDATFAVRGDLSVALDGLEEIVSRREQELAEIFAR